jgi:hypothetical protein
MLADRNTTTGEKKDDNRERRIGERIYTTCISCKKVGQVFDNFWRHSSLAPLQVSVKSYDSR